MTCMPSTFDYKQLARGVDGVWVRATRLSQVQILSKRLVRNIVYNYWAFPISPRVTWVESVVPVAVKLNGHQPKPPHSVVRNLRARLIIAGVEECLHTQTTLRGRAADQIDDRLITGSGWPRQFMLTNQNKRRSTLFHLLARHSTYTIDDFRI